jgi:hypothetical protein
LARPQAGSAAIRGAGGRGGRPQRGEAGGDHGLGHYFTGDDMLRSQFATLEPPEGENAHPVDVGQPPEAVIAACLAALRPSARPSGAADCG